MIRMMTRIAAARTFNPPDFFGEPAAGAGPGASGFCPAAGARGVPQAVQNCTESSLMLEHRGHCCANLIPPLRTVSCLILYNVSAGSEGSDRCPVYAKKSYFEMYQPVRVSSSTLSAVFFVSKLTITIATSEMTKAYAEKWSGMAAKSIPIALTLK